METNEQIERLSTQQARLAEMRLKAVQAACQAIVNPSRGLIILVGLVALALGLVSVRDVSGLVETWMGWAQATVAPGE